MKKIMIILIAFIISSNGISFCEEDYQIDYWHERENIDVLPLLVDLDGWENSNINIFMPGPIGKVYEKSYKKDEKEIYISIDIYWTPPVNISYKSIEKKYIESHIVTRKKMAFYIYEEKESSGKIYACIAFDPVRKDYYGGVYIQYNNITYYDILDIIDNYFLNNMISFYEEVEDYFLEKNINQETIIRYYTLIKKHKLKKAYNIWHKKQSFTVFKSWYKDVIDVEIFTIESKGNNYSFTVKLIFNNSEKLYDVKMIVKNGRIIESESIERDN